jgi:8-oxo-dGTP diphosphatase
MPCIDVTVPPLTPNRPLLLVVAAALIDDKNRLLLAERPLGKSMAGLWEFPGGKMHDGETPEAALVRELREELGIETSAGCFTPLTFASYGYETFHLLMPLYAIRIWQGTPTGREGQKLAWATKQEFSNYPMPPADIAIVQNLWSFL